MNLSEEIKDKKIKEFCFIDHMNEGIGYSKPEENEYFLFQEEFCGDRSEWWIVVRQKPDGKILKMINPKDVADIIFE